ncbi:membrane protein insertion efficiency factor YidD [Boudabousia liubingyangii]|uniref:Putative membrane protein insertion efficiency factor n=1 Tax=Boudabousia liubingyangii TaxID=1921764 RepID=A0A1Q5PPH4_9ACTO|nr:membrane protein insertion efficiency factor YidD [Boudabousia liubingyangii]OKL49419.1 membrane protein insertion efficiency factor YidD [Boudabousia liubingyangii]
MSFLAKPFIALIRGYQKHISAGRPRKCRYYPTCSGYAVEALQTHGLLKGLTLGTWRILRCNPWSLGGVDPVPEKGRWRVKEFPSYSEIQEARKNGTLTELLADYPNGAEIAKGLGETMSDTKRQKRPKRGSNQ